jgi:aspartate-semialdehyde dehydrogenase
MKGIQQLMAERNTPGQTRSMAYPYPIDMNCIPHCDEFLENDYTKEEMKLVNESRKILNEPELRITATAVRVPVKGGHSESVNASFFHPFTIEDVKKELYRFPGIVLKDNPLTNTYPLALYAEGKDDVFVGRIRKDESEDNSLNMWVVADNLRKGAATNAVQIAQHIISHIL